MASKKVLIADMQRAAHELAGPIERVFAELSVLATVATDVVTACVTSSKRLQSSDLSVLSSVADGTLNRYSLLGGAGVVMAPGFLEDAERYLEWRQLGRDGRPRPLLLDVDPQSEDPYDYWEMEWFRIPRDENRRMVGGPYFDYRGADRFGLTFALPLHVAGEFIGVAGADVPLAQLEPAFLPILRSLPRRAVLVNHESRVIEANTPEFAIGARVRPSAESSSVLVREVVEDLGWKLIVIPG
jgi:hypothetical protein